MNRRLVKEELSPNKKIRWKCYQYDDYVIWYGWCGMTPTKKVWEGTLI